MRPRETETAHEPAPGEMPAELMAGPCIERWAARDDGTPNGAEGKWRAAVKAWAVETGRASGPHTIEPQLLARTAHAWSRDYLIAHGNTALVDYYEGRTDKRAPGGSLEWARCRAMGR